MIADNKIDEVKEFLSQFEHEQQLPNLGDVTLCHARCYCEKCQRLINAAAGEGQGPPQSCENNDGRVPSRSSDNNNGYVPSLQTCENIDARVPSENCENNASGPPQSDENIDHIPSQNCDENKDHVPLQTCENIDAHVPSQNSENKGHFPSQNCSVVGKSSTTQCPSAVIENKAHITSTNCLSNGQLPYQSCPAVMETKCQVPLTTRPTGSESNGHIPQQTDLSVSETSKSQVVSSATSTPLGRSKCHPLCSCRHCLQLVGSDSASNSLPDVYCRNERGLSGECC